MHADISLPSGDGKCATYPARARWPSAISSASAVRSQPHSPGRQGSASIAGLLFGLALLLLAGVVVEGERIRRWEVDQRAERIQAREWCRAVQALPPSALSTQTVGSWSFGRDADGACWAEGPRLRLDLSRDGHEHWSRLADGRSVATSDAGNALHVETERTP